MQNFFASPAEYLRQQPSDTEEDVLIQPIFEDKLGQRSRASVKELPDDFAAQRGEVVDALKGNKPSQFPTRMIFLHDLKYQEIQNILPAVDMTHCNRFVGGLYQAQEEVVRMALQFKVSNVFDPAATRKSYTLATLVLFLAFTGEKVVVSSPTNVGVDSLLSKVYAEAPKFGFKGDLNYVRLYSASQVRATYAIGRRAAFDWRLHVEGVRCRVATTNPGRYTGYLQGLHGLEQQGTITAKGDQKKYNADAAKLTKEILKSAKVVFCTNAFLRSSALGPKAGDTRVVTGATTVIMDEAGCVNSGEVIMPVITFASTLRRFVLAGDPRQLPPFTLTEGARELHKMSTFEHLMKRNFPMTLLNRQFRTHLRCV